MPPTSMGKGHFPSIIGVVTILLLQLAMAQSVVNMGGVVILDDLDLGIEGGEVSPDREIVLAHGADSAIFLIESGVPFNNSRVEFSGSETLLDASFHPSGKTALLVGEEGLLLRFISSNSTVEKSGGGSAFGGTDLNAVSWNGDGSWAYIGGEEGWIWRYRGLDEGGFEAVPLENRGDSDINAISCLRGLSLIHI